MATIKMDKVQLLDELDRLMAAETANRERRQRAYDKALEGFPGSLARALSEAAKRAKAGDLPELDDTYDRWADRLRRWLLLPSPPVLGFDPAAPLTGAAFRRRVELAQGDTYHLAVDGWDAPMADYLGVTARRPR